MRTLSIPYCGEIPENLPPGKYVLIVREDSEDYSEFGYEGHPRIRIGGATLREASPLNLPAGEYTLIVDNRMPYGVIQAEECEEVSENGSIFKSIARPTDDSANDGADPASGPAGPTSN